MTRFHPQQGSTSNVSVVVLIICAFVAVNVAVTAYFSSRTRDPRDVETAKALAEQLSGNLKVIPYENVISGSEITRGNFLRTWTVDRDSLEKRVSITITWPWRSPKYAVVKQIIVSRSP